MEEGLGEGGNMHGLFSSLNNRVNVMGILQVSNQVEMILTKVCLGWERCHLLCIILHGSFLQCK